MQHLSDLPLSNSSTARISELERLSAPKSVIGRIAKHGDRVFVSTENREYGLFLNEV